MAASVGLRIFICRLALYTRVSVYSSLLPCGCCLRASLRSRRSLRRGTPFRVRVCLCCCRCPGCRYGARPVVPACPAVPVHDGRGVCRHGGAAPLRPRNGSLAAPAACYRCRRCRSLSVVRLVRGGCVVRYGCVRYCCPRCHLWPVRHLPGFSRRLEVAGCQTAPYPVAADPCGHGSCGVCRDCRNALCCPLPYGTLAPP